MRLRVFRAGTVPAALAQARAELGPEALILSTRRVADGVEVTAAFEDEAPEPPAAPYPITYPAAAEQLTLARPTAADHSALAWHGVPPAIAARMTGRPLADAIAEMLRFGTLPLEMHGPPLLLTGPPGAGKTLTIARLATRLVLGGGLPLVITADGRRAGAAEELASYTRLLGVSLVVASHPATLVRALQHRQSGVPVLIDSSGVNPFDAAQMASIAALTETAAAIPVMVLPAGYDPLESAEQAAAFAAAGVRHFVPTRLDLARRIGSVVSAAVAGGMMLSEAGTGPGATNGLTKLTAEFLIARLSQMPVPKTAKVPDGHPRYV